MLLAKTNVAALLEAAAAIQTVFAPAKVNGVTQFAPFAPGLQLELEAKTERSPKDLLLPQCEHMYAFGTREDGSTFIRDASKPTAQLLFGARPCDVRAIECTDNVFLEVGFVDEFYKARREALTIVAFACAAPDETCFCDSMGLDPNAAPTADVLLNDAGENYEVLPQTERGQALVDTWKPFLTEGAAIPGATRCALQIDTTCLHDTFIELADSDELWEAFSLKCLNCGTCTFLCPSCYCFDICQEQKGKGGLRYRCWDSCMFAEYTEMAGGHNPRATKRSRVRNRFLHKLAFFEERFGKTLCVGCGRCVEKCPVGIDITMLIERAARLREEGKEAAHV